MMMMIDLFGNYAWMHWLQMAILASTTSVSPTHSGTLTKEQFGTHDTPQDAVCEKGKTGNQTRETKDRPESRKNRNTRSVTRDRAATGAPKPSKNDREGRAPRGIHS